MSNPAKSTLTVAPILQQPIPAGVTLTAWLNAWLTDPGRIGVDDVIAAIAPYGTHVVLTSPELGPLAASPAISPSDPQQHNNLLRVIVELRNRYQASASSPTADSPRASLLARVALPQAGDPAGLVGPRETNQCAIDAGQIVVFDAAGVALIPSMHEDLWTWRLVEVTAGATPATPVRPENASQTVREALLDATTTLSAIDLGIGRARIAEQVDHLHRQLNRVDLPPSLDPTQHHTIRTAATILGICEIATAFAEPLPTSRIAATRTMTLVELATTARHCLAAAANPR